MTLTLIVDRLRPKKTEGWMTEYCTKYEWTNEWMRCSCDSRVLLIARCLLYCTLYSTNYSTTFYYSTTLLLLCVVRELWFVTCDWGACYLWLRFRKLWLRCPACVRRWLDLEQHLHTYLLDQYWTDITILPFYIYWFALKQSRALTMMYCISGPAVIKVGHWT